MSELLPLGCYDGARNQWRAMVDQATTRLGIPHDELLRRMRRAAHFLHDWVMTEIALRHHPVGSTEQLRRVVNRRWRRYLLTGD